MRSALHGSRFWRGPPRCVASAAWWRLAPSPAGSRRIEGCDVRVVRVDMLVDSIQLASGDVPARNVATVVGSDQPAIIRAEGDVEGTATGADEPLGEFTTLGVDSEPVTENVTSHWSARFSLHLP